MNNNIQDQNLSLYEVIEPGLYDILASEAVNKEFFLKKRDKLTANAILEELTSLPVIGGIFNVFKVNKDSYLDHKQVNFLQNLWHVLYGIQELDSKERKDFVNNVKEYTQGTFSNKLMNMICELEDVYKAEVLSNLIVSLIKCPEFIKIQDFFRMCFILQRIPSVDLGCLKNYVNPNENNPAEADFLYSTGVLHQTVSGNVNAYQLSYYGQMLLKYGLKHDITVTIHTGTKNNSYWKKWE